jgi:predicted  nucleic acid-binding Zn-ribbon protein
MGTQLQISLTDLNKQVLDTAQYLQDRQDNQLERILQLIAGRYRFDRVEAQINNVEDKISRVEKDLGAQIGKVEDKISRVEKDLGAQIGKVESEVAYIRAAGTVIVVLATLASKVPPSVWENLGLAS